MSTPEHRRAANYQSATNPASSSSERRARRRRRAEVGLDVPATWDGFPDWMRDALQPEGDGGLQAARLWKYVYGAGFGDRSDVFARDADGEVIVPVAVEVPHGDGTAEVVRVLGVALDLGGGEGRPEEERGEGREAEA